VVQTEESEPELSKDDAFLGTIGQGSTDLWVTKARVNGIFMVFQIDTGAEVTVISERDFKRLGEVTLMPSQRTLRGLNQSLLQVKGQFDGKIRVGKRIAEQTIYIVIELHKPLLGQLAIQALQLLKRIGAVEKGSKHEELFPNLFTGLGKLKEEYTIHLREGAQPFVLNTPRRVPVPLMQAVKDELDRMQRLGVIELVEIPTEWCVGIVVVPKTNGHVRICVDLTKLSCRPDTCTDCRSSIFFQTRCQLGVLADSCQRNQHYLPLSLRHLGVTTLIAYPSVSPQCLSTFRGGCLLF
jgi:hypothetical protein